MKKGKTTTGFEFTLTDERLNNYELMEAINEVEINPLISVKVVDLLLGKEQSEKLKNHVRTDDGFVPSDKLMEELTEILQSDALKK